MSHTEALVVTAAAEADDDSVVHDFGELLDRACDAAEFLRKVADILDRHGEAKDANDARYHADRLDSDPLDGP